MSLEALDFIASIAAWLIFWNGVGGLVRLRSVKAENGKPITNFLMNRRMYILMEFAAIFFFMIATPAKAMPGTAMALLFACALYYGMCAHITLTILRGNT